MYSDHKKNKKPLVHAAASTAFHSNMTASICLRQAEVFQGFLKSSQITYKMYLCSLLC